MHSFRRYDGLGVVEQDLEQVKPIAKPLFRVTTAR